MRVFEEFWTFVAAVGAALVLVALAAVLLSYFNPQQPLDHAKAAFYPLVKPANATHVLLGVEPYADGVAVVGVAYQHGGRWFDVPLRPTTVNKTAWLNTTDGRAVAVPCGSNVTVVTRYGSASRATSFTPLCLQREPEFRDDLTALLQQMVMYGSYVLDYAAYKSTPVLTAYLSFGTTTGEPVHVGFQNLAPFPYMAVPGAPRGEGPWPPSNFAAVALAPREYRGVHYFGTLRPAWSRVYRLLNVYAYWDDNILEIWINNVLIYNGTAPKGRAEFRAPQGFTVVFQPEGSILYPIEDPSEAELLAYDWHIADMKKGRAVQVSKWIPFFNVPVPSAPYTRNWLKQTWYVMPAGPYVGRSGGFELLGVVPPFEVYSVYAAVNGSGLVVRAMDPDCGMSERCIRTWFFSSQGTYSVRIGQRTFHVRWDSEGVEINGTRGTQSVSYPFYYRYNLTGAYPYRLEVSLYNYRYRTLTCELRGVFSVTLALYLGDRLVAYDEMYGEFGDGSDCDYSPSVSSPGYTLCVPQHIRIPKGLDHRNFRPTGGGYTVEVHKKYEVREFGCGVDRRYSTSTGVNVASDGKHYHVRDPGGNTCGYQQARTCNGIVYCGSCPSNN